MTRVATAFAAAVALFLPIGRTLLVGLTPAVGIGAGLLSTQAAYAQSAYDWWESGNEKYNKGDCQGAMADWTKAIKINPQYDDSCVNLGFSRTELGDFRGAIADYTKAIEINPQRADAYFNRGVTKSK